MAVFAHAAELDSPSALYVVSQFFSDNGKMSFYRVIDVKQDGSDSVVRSVRIAPSSASCPRLNIRAAEARVRDKSPAQLVGRNNPCAVTPTSLRAALAKYRQKGSVFETISFGIVAQCGQSSVSLGLPYVESVKLENMKSSDPAIVRLWDLGSEITTAAFGPNDIFHDRSEADDLALQRAGEKMFPELISGRYDVGLAAAVQGNVGPRQDPGFKSLLAGYQPSAPAGDANTNYVAQLVNATSYRFRRFVAPDYPPAAMQAHLQGKVELHLTVASGSGSVLSATVVSGHPLLTPPAIDAATQWRFEPNSISLGSVNVTIEFALRCQ